MEPRFGQWLPGEESRATLIPLGEKYCSTTLARTPGPIRCEARARGCRATRRELISCVHGAGRCPAVSVPRNALTHPASQHHRTTMNVPLWQRVVLPGPLDFLEFPLLSAADASAAAAAKRRSNRQRRHSAPQGNRREIERESEGSGIAAPARPCLRAAWPENPGARGPEPRRRTRTRRLYAPAKRRLELLQSARISARHGHLVEGRPVEPIWPPDYYTVALGCWGLGDEKPPRITISRLSRRKQSS